MMKKKMRIKEILDIKLREWNRKEDEYIRGFPSGPKLPSEFKNLNEEINILEQKLGDEFICSDRGISKQELESRRFYRKMFIAGWVLVG